MGSLRQTTLTCSLIGLLTQTLVAWVGFLAWTLLPKIALLEQIELVPTVLLKWILLPIIGLLGWTIIVLTCLLKLTLLTQMGLPGQVQDYLFQLNADHLCKIEKNPMYHDLMSTHYFDL